MINAKMRIYEYFTYGEPNDYGQSTLPHYPTGTVKMSISNISTTTVDSIKYKDADYIGLTLAEVNDTYVIKYGEEMLKVRYVISDGRYKQVFMSAI